MKTELLLGRFQHRLRLPASGTLYTNDLNLTVFLMSSMESFRAPSPTEGPENFEQKMQAAYLVPMNTALNGMRDLLPNLDPASRVADLLEDAFYEINTMPAENMDEAELKSNLENFERIVVDMQAATNPEEAYALALKGLEGNS